MEESKFFLSCLKTRLTVPLLDADGANPAARQAEINALLLNSTSVEYTVSLYGGNSHGFGVRANISDPRQKFGKEQAFFQAVRFFDTWL